MQKKPVLDAPRTKSSVTPLSLPEQIAMRLGHAIVAGVYKPGQRLIETDIAASYLVSRGPVRDAFQLLERRRFITIEPRKGAYVREISLNSVADILNVRAALFTTAVRFMAQLNSGQHMDDLTRYVYNMQALADDPATTFVQFLAVTDQAREAIVLGSGCELIAELLKDLDQHTIWSSLWVKPLHFDTWETRQIACQHFMAVFQAIVAGDGDAGEQGVRRLMEYNRNSVIQNLSQVRQESVSPARMLAL
jgi:DNA-binding GntR family transcriptional regulator